MKTLHRIIAIGLLFFVLAHVGNHLVAAIGIREHQAYMSVVRLIYRHPIVEPLLISAIFVQAITGGALIMAAAKRPERRSLLSWLELVSAGIFVIFIVVHLSAIVVTRFYFEMQTDFYWVADLFRESRLQPYIIGFHFLGVVAVMTHAGVGLKYMFEALRLPGFGRLLAMVFIVLGTAIAAIAIAAYSGAFYEIDLNV